MVVYKPVLVDTTDVLHDCLSAQAIAPLPSRTSPVPIAIDVEGINLCRDGRVSIIQLFVKGSDTVWLIDVTTLGNVAFNDVDDQGRSLRGFLQDTSVTKVSVILKFM
jgi:exonuclease 3'-5' domain-containing protein 1